MEVEFIMRDPARIDKFCNELAKLWHEVPDWRFAQFMYNIELAWRNNEVLDYFFVEDERFMKFMKEYFGDEN